MSKLFQFDQPKGSIPLRWIYALLCSVIIFSVPHKAFAAGEGPEIVDRWVSQSKTISFLDISYRNMSYEAEGDVTEVEDFKILLSLIFQEALAEDTPNSAMFFELTFPNLKFSGLQEDTGYYQANNITIDKIAFNLKAEGIPNNGELPITGNYIDVTVEKPRWAKLPSIVEDPEKPVSRYYPLVLALSDISFASMRVESTEVTQPTPEFNATIVTTYGSMEYGPTKNGNLSFVNQGSTSIRVINNKGEEDATVPDFSIFIGEIEMKDYNFGTFIRQFDPALPPSNAETAYQTLLGDFVIKGLGLSKEIEGVSFKIDQIRMAEVGIRPPKIAVLDRLDQLLLQSDIHLNPEENKKELIEAVGSVYGTMRLGLFELTGLDIEVKEEAAMKLGAFRLADLSSSGLGQFLLRDLGIQNLNEKTHHEFKHVRFETFEIANVGFPSLNALLNIETAAENKDINGIFSTLPTIEKIEITNFDGDSEKDTVKFGTYRFTMADFINRIPTQIAIGYDQMQVLVKEHDREKIPFLLDFGSSNTVTLSNHLSLAWNEAQQAINGQMTLTIKDAFDLSSDMRIGNIDKSMFENPETVRPQDFEAITFEKGGIRFEDRSIIERGLAFAAKQENTTPEAMVEQILRTTPFAIGGLLNDPELVQDITDAVSLLLQGNATILTVQVSAEPPIKMDEFIELESAGPQKALELLQQLDIKISTR